MGAIFIDYLKTARPRQWIKNLTLFAALIFTGNIHSYQVWMGDFWKVTAAVAAFTMVAGGIYFLNDLVDIQADKVHPFKRKRPIASGRISKKEAVVAILVLTGFGLYWSFSLGTFFGWVVAGYWVMQLFYSFWLKHVEVVDVFIIAIGFFLRVVAGAMVIDAHLSIWFLLCVISTSLFLAVGKRRAEMSILAESAAAVIHRKVMGKYSSAILDSYLSMFATAAFLSWALYTFNFYDQSEGLLSNSLPFMSRTLVINKWLMATIPVVIFGIMRYIRIVYDGSRAETPERVILADRPLLATLITWGFMVIAVLYWFH